MSVETQPKSSISVPTTPTVQVLRGPGAIFDLKPIWNDLLRNSDANTIFLTWEWAAAWCRAYARSFDLIILKCTDSNGQVVGIAPFFRVRESLGLKVSGYALYVLGDVTGGSEKLDWIVRSGWEESVVKAILDWLATAVPDWDIFFMTPSGPNRKSQASSRQNANVGDGSK